MLHIEWWREYLRFPDLMRGAMATTIMAYSSRSYPSFSLTCTTITFTRPWLPFSLQISNWVRDSLNHCDYYPAKGQNINIYLQVLNKMWYLGYLSKLFIMKHKQCKWQKNANLSRLDPFIGRTQIICHLAKSPKWRACSQNIFRLPF